MPKISKIGMSNRMTNSTNVFGNMAGLAPTANAKPFFVGHRGLSYKYDAIQNDPKNYIIGCGVGKTPHQQKTCINKLNILSANVSNNYRVGKKMLA